MIESGFLPAISSKALKEAVLVEEHHEFEELILGHFDWYFLEGVVLLKAGTLQILPLEVFLEGELVSQAEGAIGVLAQLPALEVKDQEETCVDVVLHEGRSTSQYLMVSRVSQKLRVQQTRYHPIFSLSWLKLLRSSSLRFSMASSSSLVLFSPSGRGMTLVTYASSSRRAPQSCPQILGLCWNSSAWRRIWTWQTGSIFILFSWNCRRITVETYNIQSLSPVPFYHYTDAQQWTSDRSPILYQLMLDCQQFKFMRHWLFLCLPLLLQAKQQIVPSEVVQSSVGLLLLLLAGFAYFMSTRPPKQVVVFEHFELTHPPTPVPVLKEAKDDPSTSFPSVTLKEMSFESEGTSPSQRKRRKRKAHRLSDRRRNNQNDCEEVEQGSQLSV